MNRLALVAAMGLDLVSWLLVPEPIRVAAESNAFVPYVSPVALKVLAILVILGLLTRLTTRQPTAAIRLAVAITIIGAASNLTGLWRV